MEPVKNDWLCECEELNPYNTINCRECGILKCDTGKIDWQCDCCAFNPYNRINCISCGTSKHDIKPNKI